MQDFITEQGSNKPLGATLSQTGVNFAVFAPKATKVELCLFDESGIEELAKIPMHKTGKAWHIFVKGIKVGQRYGYRAFGEYAPYNGLLFNPNKLLLDPYAKAVFGDARWHKDMLPYNPKEPVSLLSFSSSDSAPFTPKVVVVDEVGFDWQGDTRPATSWADTVIYELNVKAMTALNDNVPVAMRGKFLGLSTPFMIDYFKKLGVTALELMPSQNFFTNFMQMEKGLSNFWGYDQLCFFAPHNAYLVNEDKPFEFKEMVRELHKAGLEVILDIAFNHTTEGAGYGPMLSFKGLDNEEYYKLNPANKMEYIDETGCGASFNMNSPVAVKLVIDALLYWAEVMHVDGFRFDLASELVRGASGKPERDSLFLQAILAEPRLARLKLIAEPWDLGAEGYKLGWFPAPFAEWNDRYRNAVRKFWKGDKGVVELAKTLAGSTFDVFKKKTAHHSINFVTAHDGFSLYDLVSYEQKHNLANGEGNRDGTDYNLSWNGGVEGETDDKAIIALRWQRMRSIMATLMLSLGTPMMLYGDEKGRTRKGNNNAYCQDNELTWLPWTKEGKGADFFDFVSALIHFRREYNVFDTPKMKGYTPEADEMSLNDWLIPYARTISYTVEQEDRAIFVILNAYDDKMNWTLPPAPKGKKWQLVFDTAVNINGDFGGEKGDFAFYAVAPWSVVCFKAI